MMRRFVATIWRSSQSAIKQEREESVVSDGHEEIGDVEMDVEDLIAIARVQEEGEGERSRKPRKSQDSEVQDEEREEQFGWENGEDANNGHAENDAEGLVPNRMEGAQKTINFGLDGTFGNEEYAEKSKRSRKSNGAAKKRKRKSADSDHVFHDEPEEGTEEEVAVLLETKSAKNRGRNMRSRKSQNAVVEGEALDLEATQIALPEPEEEQVPADLAELPKKLRRAKKNAKVTPHKALDDIAAAAEDDNDSAAALHRPLTPAHMGHHRTSSRSHEEAAAQLQNDAQSSGPPAPEDDLQMTPEQPSKKALGKRKASDVEVGVSKRRKTQKDKAAGTPELASFGFTSLSEPQRRSTPMFTPINGPKAPILPPSATRPVVEIPVRNHTDDTLFVPEPPKFSEPKKKRRLPVRDVEPSPKTPVPKGSQKSKTPKSAATTPRPRAAGTTGNGRLSNEEIEAITIAVGEYRDQNDLTQIEINDLIQKDAKTDGLQLWKYIYGEVPDIPRQKVLNTCRRKFHNFEARGSWTEEQDQEFREAYAKYPGKWTKIGEALHRFPEDCRDRWRNYLVCGDNMKKDVWEKEEEERLKEVVEEVIGLVREMKRVSTDPRVAVKSAESLVDWNVVSQKMDHTRSRLQCIQKWKKIKEREVVVVGDPVIAKPISETWRLEVAELAARKMKPKEKLLLLYAVRDSGAGREGKIPWRRVQEEVPGRPRKMAMRVAFRQMRQHIEGNEDMALQDIVDLLVDAFEASVPSEPPGFDDDFELFHSSEKILSAKKKRKSKAKAEAEAEVESSSDDNGEGPSTITKPKRKTRLSEKFVSEDDGGEDDPFAAPQDEQPTKSKRRKAASSLQTEDGHVDSSATKKKRKLRERMKDVGQSQSQSQESHEHHSELSDVHTALESLKSGTSRARRAAAKEATKSKAKVLSDERVVESDEEQAPANKEEPPLDEEPSENRPEHINVEQPSADVEEIRENEEEESASREQPSANLGEGSENEAKPLATEEQPSADVEEMSRVEEEPSANKQQLSSSLEEASANIEQPSANLENASENEEEPPVDEEESSENEAEPPADEEESSEDEDVAPGVNGYTITEAEEDQMDLDQISSKSSGDEQESSVGEEETSEDEMVAPGPNGYIITEAEEDQMDLGQTNSQSSQDVSEAEEDGLDLHNHDSHRPQDGSKADEDGMELDNHNAYTAPGGPEADDAPSSEDEEDLLLHNDQESAVFDEAEDEEERTQHYDHESVDLDAARDPTPDGVPDENENPGSDAETDFHGFQDGDGDGGSVDLDTPVRTDYRKRLASPVTFEEETPKINGFANGHRHAEEEEPVSSDDDDMSDIPAVVPKVKPVESKKKTKPKSKTKTKVKRPLGFR